VCGQIGTQTHRRADKYAHHNVPPLCRPIPLKKKFAPPKFPMEQWKNENYLYFCLRPDRNFKFHLRLASFLCISIFVPTSKKSLCRMPNVNVQADYFLPIISDCTLIPAKIQPFTYTERLLLLVILDQTYRIWTQLSTQRRKQQHVQCSHRLAKIAQTAQNKRATGSTIVAMTTLTSVKGCCVALMLGMISSWNDCYICANFL